MDINKACSILGVAYQDSIELAKKAYRKLAVEKHPDKNKKDPNANETFMTIQEAFKYFLKIKQDSNVKSTPSVGNESIEQLPPNEFDLKLTLEEIFFGCVKREKINRKIRNTISGEIEEEEKFLEVNIQPGVPTGSRILIEREGDIHLGRIPANVVFMVSELPHQHCTRSRFHLEHVAKITTEEACLGQLTVPTLEKDDPLQIEMSQLITSTTVKRFPGKGFPHPSGNGTRGDLIIRFEIIYEPDRPQDPPIEHDLKLTLEQILHGYKKVVKINRKVFNEAGNDEQAEEKLLTIDVKPGTLEGTRFKFYQKGDKHPNTIPADIIFIVRDKPHPIFKRKGANLEYSEQIYQMDAHNWGHTFTIPTLDGGEIELNIEEPITYSTEKTLVGYGLPLDNDAQKRGDLIVRFEIIKEIDPPIEYDLGLTLENILHGLNKRLQITKTIFDEEGNKKMESKVLTINVKPGIESGTRFIFPQEGDQFPDTIPGDLIFVAKEKPHDTFTRSGVHLKYTAKLTQNLFARGGEISIPTLNGDYVFLSLDNILKLTNAIKRIGGHGLPYENDAEKRGDLIVNFEIIQGRQDPPVEYELFVAMELVANGGQKRVKITRQVQDELGDEKTEEKIVALNIRPGIKAGARVSFPCQGDRIPGRIPADVVFIIRDKPHDIFRRNGANIEYTAKINSEQAQNGFELIIPTLDKGNLTLMVNGGLTEDSVETIPEKGLLYSDEINKRGDLNVHFEIVD